MHQALQCGIQIAIHWLDTPPVEPPIELLIECQYLCDLVDNLLSGLVCTHPIESQGGLGDQ